MRSLWSLLLLLVASLAKGAAPRAAFTENKGQWPASVLYRVMLPNGALFVEREAFTYVLQTGGAAHHHGEAKISHVQDPLVSHAFRVHFEGGHASGSVGGLRQEHYENFFLGNDPARWGTGCGIFGEVVLKEVWPGIDLRLDGRTGLKYELIVSPGADPSQVRFRYEGHDGLSLKEGALIVKTSAGNVVEEPPVSWSSFFDGIDNQRLPVPSAYRLQGNTVTFDVKARSDLPLTIDPTLTFASFSGSNADNFGFTATYDVAGHLYGGGIVFGIGYPTTLGVLDDSFSGGTIDVGISKFTPDGTSLVWSTYIGGSGNESPHSMVVNENDELYVFGSTGSSDLPTTAGCLDNTFGGGPALTFIIGYGYDQPFGTDMFVAHLNNTATSLLGCTYLGDSGNDGINNAPELAHNYGDSFRGEIIMDVAGNPVVASNTSSPGLPVVGGPQSAYGGGSQDGYCFRLDPSLSTVLWSTYIGGQGADAAYGVQMDSDGELFVAGGTASSDLPMTGTPFKGNFSGTTDGFIMRYGLDGTLSGSTYLGTAAYDQCYFVQLNTADEVFVVGQTRGNYPVTPGKYTNPGSSQFIHKLDHALSTSLWSTRFGNGSFDQDLSPTAFLVSDCGQIYFSGWGGVVNSNAGNSNSTTTGLEVTADAFQSDTDGNDLYLMLLEPEAIALNYATFFGGGISAEHVDGGTSRFDKNGNVYQAVCAGCHGNSDFPTTPGAWSNTNNATTGCNLGVLKFDLARSIAIISIDGPNVLCTPGSAQFLNSSTGGNTYDWDFGDGTSSNEAEPLVTYTTVDTFTVTMILSDNSGCYAPDTASLEVITLPPPEAQIDPVPPLCVGLSVQLQASGGDTYEWIPTTDLDDPTIADPTLTPTASGEWSVVVTTQCGSDTTDVLIDLSLPQGSAGDDMQLCLGQSAELTATGGGTYAWNEDPSLSDLTSATPTATPTETTTYIVEITTPEGCISSDTLEIAVITGTPEPMLDDTVVCTGSSVQLIAPEADTYAWESTAGLTDPTVRDPIVTPSAPNLYVVLVTNVCGAIRDSAFVDVITPHADAWPDSVVCPNEPVLLGASGGVTFEWSPAQGLNDPNGESPTARVTGPATYTVTTTDAFGCVASATLVLGTHPVPFVSAGNDRAIDFGDELQLAATGQGTFVWEPPFSLSCSECDAPIAKPLETTVYTVTLTDANGCKVQDAVTVILNGSLFVPNTFSPNGDDVNDVFGAWGKEIKTLTMMVFNRWGELIWTGGSLDAKWDGTYGGQQSPIDTYVWRIDVEELIGKKRTLYGHVNLVR
ncbi:MAG: gliding motility-associated C-terminal domain-containing protein [Flavobacteriales bacterium]|nr:gliding motility-associated C-terminal domain-containing protein [Flavobacteriales bacterium]